MLSITRACILVALVCASPVRAAVSLPREVQDLRAAYDTSLASLDAELKAQEAQVATNYQGALEILRDELQQSGRLRPLVAVHDELARFGKERQPGGPSPDSVELAELQQEHLARLHLARYSNEMQVVQLAERYLQALHVARAALGPEARPDDAKAILLERDRILASSRVRTALQGTRMPPDEGTATNAVAAAGNGTRLGVDKTRNLKLYRLATEDVAKVMAYSMTLQLAEDASRLKIRESDAGMTTTRSEEGAVIFLPRVEISCRNAEIAAGAELTIEYYSRSLTDGGYRRENAETIALPRIARGESATVEGRGVSIYRSMTVTHTGRGPDARSVSGAEFHGALLTIRDQNREILLVRFTPQTLSKLVELP